MKYLFTIIVLCACIQICHAQKIIKVYSEYTYYAPESMSLDEAKQVALKRAKIQAIADEFGTTISQSNTTVVQNGTEKSESNFLSLSESDVKGEWIETIGTPQLTPKFENGLLYINVVIEGKIREIISAPIDISARILCNGMTSKYERSDFKNGDDMYLEFQSPTNGYLVVYLVDILSNTAYCLLPYRESSDVVQHIQKDRRYVFFSAKQPEGHDIQEVDEYTMTCSKQPERNDMYIIFSPNPLVKANSKDVGELCPRQLQYNDFQKWLSKNRTRDKDFQVIHKFLTISY